MYNRFLISTSALLLALVITFIFPYQAIIVGFLILCIIYVFFFAVGVSSLRLQFFGPSYTRGVKKGNYVSLTFDDGPDPNSTPQVIEILKNHQVRVAFFVIGNRVIEHPELTRAIVDNGHIVCNHSHRHAWWNNFLAGAYLERELRSAQEAIHEATRNRPALYRPPVGLSNPHMFSVLKKIGLSCVGWDVRSFDRKSEPDKTLRRILKQVRDGSIIVLHDGCVNPKSTAYLLEHLLTSLKDRGFQFSRLDHLLKVDAYQQDSIADREDKKIIEEKPVFLNALFKNLVYRLGSTKIGQQSILDNTRLSDITFPPSIRTSVGLVIILLSMILGWPAVSGFAIAALALEKPLVFLGGPISYVLSWLIWIIGMYLVGPESIAQGKILMQWAIKKIIQKYSDGSL